MDLDKCKISNYTVSPEGKINYKTFLLHKKSCQKIEPSLSGVYLSFTLLPLKDTNFLC